MPAIRCLTSVWARFLFWVALFVGVPSIGTAKPKAPKKGISLADCIKRALSENPLIKAARFGVDISKAKLFRANWARFPKLTVTSALAPIPAQEGNLLQGHTNYNRWGVFTRTEVEGYMPLFTFGKIRHLQRAARHGVKVEQARVRLVESEISYLVRKAYWGFQLATEVAEIVDKGLKRLRKEKKRIQTKLDKNDKDVDQNDLLRIRIAEAEIVGRQLEAKRLKVRSASGLRLLVGLGFGNSIVLSQTYIDPLGISLKPLEAHLAFGLKHRPDLRAVEQGVKARLALLRQKKSYYYPDLVLGGFVRYAYSNVADDQPSPFASDPYNTLSGGIFVAIRWSLDFPMKIGQVREADAQYRQLLLQQKALREKAKYEIQNAWLEARDQCQMLGLLRKASRAARAIMTDEGRSYDEGFSKLSDLLKAVVTYYTKDLQRLEAIYKCNLAVAKLSQMVGARGLSIP
ncbi:MAG: TolC family protein [Myxococcales bacterium]|nr:TolC family protein [Myxococcales bacterium]